jgi:hypothetical protein
MKNVILSVLLLSSGATAQVQHWEYGNFSVVFKFKAGKSVQSSPEAFAYVWSSASKFLTYKTSDLPGDAVIFADGVFGAENIPSAGAEGNVSSSDLVYGKFVDLGINNPRLFSSLPLQNELGKTGWELVSAVNICEEGCVVSADDRAKGLRTYTEERYWFKRLAK